LFYRANAIKDGSSRGVFEEAAEMFFAVLREHFCGGN